MVSQGFGATFYVNSGTIGTAGKLTWAELTMLSQAGSEIASHSVRPVLRRQQRRLHRCAA